MMSRRVGAYAVLIGALIGCGAVRAAAAAPRTSTTAALARRAAIAFVPKRPTRTSAAAAPRASTGSTVTISSNCSAFCFVPAQLTIPAGGTVAWTDKTGTEHIIARCNPANCNGASAGTGTDATFTSAHVVVDAGATRTFTFSQPGTYVYYCTIHGYALMHGTITVTAAAPTTTAAPATTAASTATTVGPPQLAHTGGDTNGAVALALALIVLGLTATAAGVRRRTAGS